MVVNTLVVILLTATIVSIVAQIVRSHESDFKIRWFVFYFLIYANITWLMVEFILPELAFQSGVFSSIVIGFTLAGAVAIIHQLNIRYHSVPWISLILLIILIITNLESLQIALPIQPFLEKSSNSSGVSEEKQVCPTSISALPVLRNEERFDPKLVGPVLNNLINSSVWRMEGNIRSCYKGKYKGQYPDWFYCDDMIVSRWETSISGTIRYRWYTAVTAEWQPNIQDPYGVEYVFNGFSCENGKKVTVNKETTAYYVHISRDGTEIKVEY